LSSRGAFYATKDLLLDFTPHKLDMTPSATPTFNRVAILGTGLIGGSFALALRKHLPNARIIGFDHEPSVLREAQSRSAIHESAPDIASAVAGADLIYVALPISATMEALPEIAHHAAPTALVTDACSTKRSICRVAAMHFKSGAYFLGGHPMAGKESHGIAAADADLFRGANYALIGDEESPRDPRAAAFAALIESIGARVMWLDADTHDWAAAIISHLPQMTAIALAEVIAAETDETGLPASLAGSGARGMLRLAGSPYSMWRDIAVSNSDNLRRALDRLAQAIDHLRNHLNSRDLEQSFDEANRLHESLKNSQK
jgi:prephenate dehydrogenase